MSDGVVGETFLISISAGGNSGVRCIVVLVKFGMKLTKRDYLLPYIRAVAPAVLPNKRSFSMAAMPSRRFLLSGI